MAILVVLLVLLLTEPRVSQTIGHDNDTNLLMGMFCGRKVAVRMPNFINNRNTAFNDIRMQLLSKRVLYAIAQALSAGDPVYATTQCRNYLSVDQCVACFDASVSKLVNCTTAYGYISFDDCFIRYEDFNEFYNDPYSLMDGTGLQYVLCGNQSSSQPTTFNQVVDRFLSNIRDATPKTSNFFVADIGRVISENATVYVTGQCVEHINQTVCQSCMNTAYDRLTDCLPSTQGRFSDVACFARYSETPFFNDNQTTDITNVIKGHSSKLVVIVAAAIGGVSLFLIILILWLWYRLRKKSKKTEQGLAGLNWAVHYDYNDLRLATNNFSQENVLGKGGFGEVFKNVVAVKRIQVRHAGAKDEFENEVKLISNIHHKNLLRLLGWSSEGSHLLLVLDYMPNGSLDRFLWGSKRGTLNWNQRYEVIFGVARGLAHLHHEFHVKIIHRDIKSSNILLADDFTPKIADFGLARFQPEDQSHVSTGFAGTLGYTAPEYVLHGFLSDKVDTYSFGVVILEIISGRRSTEVRPYKSSTCWLLEDAWEMYENKKHISVIEETLNLNEYEQEHVMKIIEIALLCTLSPASDRPAMSEVVSMLQEGRSLGKRQLKRPTYLSKEGRRIHMESIHDKRP